MKQGQQRCTDNYENYAVASAQTKRGRRHRLFLKLAYNIWKRLLKRLVKRSSGSGQQVTIVECGSGPGILLNFIARWFPQVRVMGIDCDYQLVKYAFKEAPRGLLINAAAEELPLASNAADIIISLHMVEHLKNPQAFIKEAERILKPQGALIVSTPNPQGAAARILGKKWSGWRNDHLCLQPPLWWRSCLISCGFEIVKEGTTGLSGLGIFKKSPLALLNWGLLFIFGFFPWKYGESYVCVAKKEMIERN